MNIQFNTDNNIPGVEKTRSFATSLISDGLIRFDKLITRMEVHLSDEDGSKDGLNDKRCVLEGRLKGRQPIVVTHRANSHEQAINGAVEKMKNSLERIVGRMRR
jgi:hypothetical protein